MELDGKWETIGGGSGKSRMEDPSPAAMGVVIKVRRLMGIFMGGRRRCLLQLSQPGVIGESWENAIGTLINPRRCLYYKLDFRYLFWYYANINNIGMAILHLCSCVFWLVMFLLLRWAQDVTQFAASSKIIKYC